MPRYNILTPAGDSILDDTNDAIRVMNVIASSLVVGVSAKIEDTSPANVLATDSGAGLKWHLTDVIITNSDATVGTLVTIQDDEGSPTVLCQGYVGPAGGKWSHAFAGPPVTAANAHIHAVCATNSAEVYVTVVAYAAA